MQTIVVASLVVICGGPTTPDGMGSETSALVARIKAVGREGSGNVEASKAWKEVTRFGPDWLPVILAAFDGADARAANWLRSAVDTIAERALAAGKSLPAAELEAFILQKDHDGAARRLAYEWLVRIDSKAPDRLLPGMLHDPSGELRRDAVARVLKEAQQKLDKKDNAAATAEFRKALSGARDKDQVDLIATRLKGLGVEVDLPAHFGFIQKWMLVGPFDNSGGAGFRKAYPPEHKIDLGESYFGKKDTPLRWTEHSTQDRYGLVDLNKALGKNMGAVAYAAATVVSANEQPIHIRVGSNNAVKIFLNGKQIFFREEYHHGMDMDQHVGTGTLRAGRNEILIKVCQNEQSEEWAQSWSFQLRVCDSLGGAVRVTPSAARSVAIPVERKAER